MANVKISQLPAASSVVATDLVAIVDDPSGTPTTQRATWTLVRDYILGMAGGDINLSEDVSAAATVTVGTGLTVSAGGAAVTGNSTITGTLGGITVLGAGQLNVDNVRLDGNTLSSLTGALNITPVAGSAIVLDGTISVDAGVVTGATSITSTAFVGALTGNVTGNVSGTAATVTTAAQPAITSVGTLTALQVDNINVNGNTISSTAGTDLNITPLAGQQIVLDGTIVIDAGVVTGAASITSTSFVGALTGNASTATTATTASTAAAWTTARTIWGQSVNGTADVTGALTVASGGINITGSSVINASGLTPSSVFSSVIGDAGLAILPPTAGTVPNGITMLSSAGTSTLTLSRFSGTLDTPTPTSAVTLGTLRGGGYDGVDMAFTPSMTLSATETWSATAHGSKFGIFTCANGSISSTMVIEGQTGTGVSVGVSLDIGDTTASISSISSTTRLRVPAGTTTRSPLRIPHGTAPSSPVNGDIWTTTAGLFVRINGATIGPLT